VAAGSLYACDGSSYWIDVGTPQQYLEAQMDLLDGVFGGGVDGVDPAARVDPTATVERSVLGPGVVIAAGARVERSVLLAGAQVGPDAEVSDSVLGERAVVAQGASAVGGTIVGDGEIVEQGMRLDGARVPVPS
jgi:NDP-sugar pyrophosphorylase family protein